MNIIDKIKDLWRNTGTVDQCLKTWSDEECLQNFMKFFKRVDLGTEFQKTDKIITHEVLVIRCGDATATSPPLQLSWPMRPVSATFKSSMLN